MTATANGHNLLAAEIALRLERNWTAEIQVDAEAPLTGSVTLEIDGVAFSATVAKAPDGSDESVIEGGRCLARIVGGAGGLSKSLPAKAYVSTTVRGVVSDILRETGERLSSTVDAGILGTSLAKWQREAEIAGDALTVVVEHAGAIWRMLRDGTIWIGRDTWPKLEPAHVVIDRPSPAVIAIAPEAPELVPGVTFLGHRVRAVTHYLSGKLRTDVYVESIADALDKLFAPLRRQIDYSRLYPARVVSQAADGTLEIVPDDPVVKGAGARRVQLVTPYPGEVKLLPGARVMLGFMAGDPERAYASQSAGTGASLEQATIGNPATAQPVAQMGGTVAVFIPTAPVTGGNGIAGVPVGVPPGIWVTGTISVGAQNLKAS